MIWSPVKEARRAGARLAFPPLYVDDTHGGSLSWPLDAAAGPCVCPTTGPTLPRACEAKERAKGKGKGYRAAADAAMTGRQIKPKDPPKKKRARGLDERVS
jgi:hypothetical protein